jgi:hypothetical protein
MHIRQRQRLNYRALWSRFKGALAVALAVVVAAAVVVAKVEAEAETEAAAAAEAGAAAEVGAEGEMTEEEVGEITIAGTEIVAVGTTAETVIEGPAGVTVLQTARNGTEGTMIEGKEGKEGEILVMVVGRVGKECVMRQCPCYTPSTKRQWQGASLSAPLLLSKASTAMASCTYRSCVTGEWSEWRK